ncbi:MAG: multidrug efflux SMR transporter [Deltaproteobacteria bacterium]|nr:multidrug efflux SMR transporter [Deltaproteobacteria bacterium]
MLYWSLLIAAIVFEVFGTVSMKLSNGMEKFLPSLLIFFFYGCSFIALTFALKKIDVGVAYAVWSGVGTALVALIGFFYFREIVTVQKIFFITLIIAGVAGLYMTEAVH